jgi:Domain of unknown function (DUF4157)
MLGPYIPIEDLSSARLYDGVVPWYLGSAYRGIARGNRIYFRPGVYTPTTAAGMALLGHELVHVGQYRQGATWLTFLASYARHGYANCPLEIAARRVETRIRDELQINRKTPGEEVS